MSTISGISTAAFVALMLIASSGGAQEPISPATAVNTTAVNNNDTVSSHSRVRIVRLSEVKGEVQLDRQTGKGFESAMANLPVIEGEKLKTGNGVAEVEFEDNSTVRVAQDSVVEFPRLELLPSGAKASSITVLKGTVYISLVNTKGNEFSVTAGHDKINLPPDSHVRLQLTEDHASLAVMHGDAQVEQAASSTTVGKNKTMTFDLAGQNEPVIAKNVEQEPLDSWDHDATQYHKSFANASSYGNAPYAYGINDLNYYGSFASGCGGSYWRPYFTSASWDPFSSGAWAYYPSAGYSWVSPYPWGWTPYHYGSWAFCQGLGWGWQPGGNWMGLANNSFGSSPSPIGRPRPPLHPPTAAETTMVPVNMKAIPASTLGAHDTFVFRKDSAGFGVPRGSLGKLNSYSGQTVQHGAASMSVYSGPSSQRAESGARGSYSGPVPAYGPAPSISAAPGPSAGSMSSPGLGSSHASAGSSGGARH